MAKLTYASNLSLDGWTEDEHGGLDWAPRDEGVFAFITELMRSAGTYLYGRRMYEALAVWETDPTLAEQSDLMADYANAWQAADKVVYSLTLAAPPTANTRVERHFDPSAVRELKAASGHDLLVGGPNLAGQALAAGLVDELALFVWPVILGGRKPALSPTGKRVELELIDEHRFGSGAVYVRYQLRSRQGNRTPSALPRTPRSSCTGSPRTGWSSAGSLPTVCRAPWSTPSCPSGRLAS